MSNTEIQESVTFRK